MNLKQAYTIGRLGGYGAASLLLASVLCGCSTSQPVCSSSQRNFRVPQAHIEMHKKMMANQHKLIIPEKSNESSDD